jgi:hypothetical protein
MVEPNLHSIICFHSVVLNQLRLGITVLLPLHLILIYTEPCGFPLVLRFEIFMEVKIKIVVFLAMVPCNFLHVYRHFRETCYPHSRVRMG